MNDSTAAYAVGAYMRMMEQCLYGVPLDKNTIKLKLALQIQFTKSQDPRFDEYNQLMSTDASYDGHWQGVDDFVQGLCEALEPFMNQPGRVFDETLLKEALGIPQDPQEELANKLANDLRHDLAIIYIKLRNIKPHATAGLLSPKHQGQIWVIQSLVDEISNICNKQQMMMMGQLENPQDL